MRDDTIVFGERPSSDSCGVAPSLTMGLENGDSGVKRGALIVIEGLDRTGKSTQCARLVQALQAQGLRAKGIRFPDRGTPTGKIIDTYLRGDAQQDDHAIHLLFSANRWEAAAKIREDVSTGVTVVVDRYSYSGAVYSAAKDKDDLSLHWAWQPEIGLPRPDIWFFLNLSHEEAAKRGGYGEERYEKAGVQIRVGELYASLVGIENNEEMRVVDAGKSEDEVADDIHAQTWRCVSNMDAIGPLRKLEPMRFRPDY